MITDILVIIAILILSYLIGSINTAIIIGRIFDGDDIRSHGSGNAGATNALRTYGVPAAILVTLGDCFKAAVCCVIALLTSKLFPLNPASAKALLYIASIGVVLGHNFPLYFGFKGGKGILVSVTALIFADWRIGVTVLVIALIIIAVTRYVSLGSVMGAVMFIIAALVLKRSDIYYTVSTLFLGGLAIVRHRTNIKRLFNGTESKIGSNNQKGTK